MKYVLDSNVFKKISSQKRNKSIDKWLASIDDADLFITALTVQETQEGIERLRKNKDPAKVAAANEIERRFAEYLSEYEDRILPVDAKAAREWGRRLAKHGTKKANDLAIISIEPCRMMRSLYRKTLAISGTGESLLSTPMTIHHQNFQTRKLKMPLLLVTTTANLPN